MAPEVSQSFLHLYYDAIYTDGIDPAARFPRERYRLLAERLGDNADIQLSRPPIAGRSEILLAHDTSYVDAFLSNQLDERSIRKIGLRPWTPALIERTLRLLGGSLAATHDALRKATIAGNMAGGTHHAFADHGAGYCVFNDLAVCARSALQLPSVNRVLILDLDVHQGDGTAAILADQPEIFTCSIHANSNFPFRKQTSDLDIALPDGTSDDAYLEILDETLARLQPERFDLILFQAGVDGLAEDALGRLNLTRAGLQKRNERVFNIHRANGIPLVVFMGGGYAVPIERTVEAFADLFLQAAAYRRH